MVAVLISLKLRLLVAALKRSVWQTIGLVICALYGLGIAASVLIGLIFARFISGEDYSLIGSVIGVIGLVMGLAHLILPFMYGVDDSMAPSRFISYGITPKRLAPGLLVAAFISIVVICEIIAILGVVVFMSVSVPSAIIAVLSCALFIVLLVLSSRVVVGVGSQLFAGRRAKEAVGVVSIVAVSMMWFVISPLVTILSDGGDIRGVVTTLGAIASVTPWGALIAAPTLPIGQGLLALAYGCAAIAVLYYCWYLLVAKQTSQMLDNSGGDTKGYSGLGLFSRFPQTIRGGITARLFTYWWRDNRYRSSLIMALLMPLGVGLIAGVNGVPGMFIVGIILVMLIYIVPLTVFNDIAYDNTAFAWHVLAGVRGKDDVIARLIGPAIVCAVVITGLTTAIACSPFAQWTLLTFGGAVCLVGTTLGIGAVMMVQFPYAAVAPGGSPMKKPKGANTFAAVIQAIGSFATLILVVPVAVFAGLYLWQGAVMWLYIGAVTGLIIGVGALCLGLWLGCRIYDRRQVDIYATIRKFADAD